MIALAMGLAGCTAWERYHLNREFGKPDSVTRLVTAAGKDPEYHRDIRPLIETRCTVCHGCYDAPCQLKLDAYAGVERGASKAKVYDGTRLLAANLTRLFVDASNTGEWRDKGFSPVLNERQQSPAANTQGSVMYRMLALKEAHPLPQEAILPASFDFSLDRAEQCTTIEEMPAYEKKYPLWGMPYGLPGLSSDESQLLMRWIETGAQTTVTPEPDARYQAAIATWEALLNRDDLRSQVSARYIYEHLFYGNLYFSELPLGPYFRLVRSSTPPGEPIREIATRRPYDDPGVPRVYYRLWHNPSSTLDKTHMPYALDAQRMQRWKALFFDAGFAVGQLPGYEPELASNPFATFRELPAQSRYRFMLDDARFIIQGFIKGPVCRGQLALNVIDDRFWVMFVDPEHPSAMDNGNYLAQHSEVLQLPAAKESNVLPITNWLRYAKLQREWLQAKGSYFQENFPQVVHPTVDVIWNGEQSNPNAALTVFRHFDSATVSYGWVGTPPKTAWVIGYPLLERIHYLLVAGFDVYGNLGHQLVTRLYMDFLRMEGEANFLLLLPEPARKQALAHWYQDAPEHVMKYVDDHWLSNRVEPAITYRSADPKRELFGLLEQHFGNALDQHRDITHSPLQPATIDALQNLENLRGEALSLMPETAFLVVQAHHGEYPLTILHNNGYKNLSTLFMENSRRLPDEDSLTIANGFLGAYPNALFHVHEHDVALFTNRIRQMRSAADYTALMDRFGVRRSETTFWAFSDRIHQLHKATNPTDAGLFDYNRLENR
ncbi:MAG: 9-hexadecenoic acid cis-trans isomerase [Gammaproteobacteria bacterium]|nr:MAG: 9-hexadecenoic acid cis-trans isomerase [Gammaproteobacteria bacterium]